MSTGLHNNQYPAQSGLAKCEGRQRAIRVGLRGGRRRSYTPAERLWARTDKTSSLTGCWVVSGAALPHSGHVQINRKAERLPVIRAHRLAWELLRGPIPAGLSVLHICDNPRCVNPDHLRLGTQADNIADAVGKGRFSAWHRSGHRLNGQLSKRHQKMLDRVFQRVPSVRLAIRGGVS